MIRVSGQICQDERKILTNLRVFLILAQFNLRNANPKARDIKQSWEKKHIPEEEKSAKQAYRHKVFRQLALKDDLVAKNTNSGHEALPAYKYLEKRTPKNTKKTKKQGDGTSFNAALELAFAKKIEKDGEIKEKIYKTKYFIVGNKFQIAGILDKDLADAWNVARSFVKLFRECLHERLILVKPTEPKNMTKPEIKPETKPEIKSEVIEKKNECERKNPSSEMRNYICHVVLNDKQEIDIKILMNLLVKLFPEIYVKFHDKNTTVLISVINEPVRNPPKIKLFRKGTIKFLGKFNDENAVKHYNRISETISKNKEDLIYTPGQ
jgi:hypothetical protein